MIKTLLLIPLLAFATVSDLTDAKLNKVSDKDKLLFKIDARTSTKDNSTEIKFFITPDKGYKWGADYNAKLTLNNGKKVVNFSKLKFFSKNGDFKKTFTSSVVVSIPAVGLRVGKETITGTLNCLICNDVLCRPYRNVEIEFPVVVE